MPDSIGYCPQLSALIRGVPGAFGSPFGSPPIQGEERHEGDLRLVFNCQSFVRHQSYAAQSLSMPSSRASAFVSALAQLASNVRSMKS